MGGDSSGKGTRESGGTGDESTTVERGQKEWGNRRRNQNSGKGTGVERGAERVGEEEGGEQDRRS